MDWGRDGLAGLGWAKLARLWGAPRLNPGDLKSLIRRFRHPKGPEVMGRGERDPAQREYGWQAWCGFYPLETAREREHTRCRQETSYREPPYTVGYTIITLHEDGTARKNVVEIWKFWSSMTGSSSSRSSSSPPRQLVERCRQRRSN